MASPTAAPDIPGFELVRRLGAGAFGEVYLARQTSLDRAVALKVLSRFVKGDDGAAARLRKEAELLASLVHPGIVPVFDAGAAPDGTLYLALEFVRGETLEGTLRREGPLPWARLAPLLRPVLEGLAHAHDRGILHRDVKPANVLVDARGRGVLADFGLALAERVDWTRWTRQGALVGTPQYLSPERLLGMPASAASDVYAAATMLHLALTGAPPGGRIQEIGELVDRIDREPEALPEDLAPAPFREALRRALHPKPPYRPTALELADLLHVDPDPSLTHTSSVGARPASQDTAGSSSPVAPVATRRASPAPALLAAGALAAVALAAGTGIFSAGGDPPVAPAPREERPAPAPAWSLLDEIPADLRIEHADVLPVPFPSPPGALRGHTWIAGLSDVEVPGGAARTHLSSWAAPLPAGKEGSRAVAVVLWGPGGPPPRPEGAAAPSSPDRLHPGTRLTAWELVGDAEEVRLAGPANGPPARLRGVWLGHRPLPPASPSPDGLGPRLTRIRLDLSLLDARLREASPKRESRPRFGNALELPERLARSLRAGPLDPRLERWIGEIVSSLAAVRATMARVVPTLPEDRVALLHHAAAYLRSVATLDTQVPATARSPELPGGLATAGRALAEIQLSPVEAGPGSPAARRLTDALAEVERGLPGDLRGWVELVRREALLDGAVGLLTPQRELLPHMRGLVDLATRLPPTFRTPHGGLPARLRGLAVVLGSVEDHLDARRSGFRGPEGRALVERLLARFPALPPGPARDREREIVGRVLAESYPP